MRNLLCILINVFWMKVSSTGSMLSTNINASPKNQVLYIIEHPIIFIKTFFVHSKYMKNFILEVL